MVGLVLRTVVVTVVATLAVILVAGAVGLAGSLLGFWAYGDYPRLGLLVAAIAYGLLYERFPRPFDWVRSLVGRSPGGLTTRFSFRPKPEAPGFVAKQHRGRTRYGINRGIILSEPEMT